MDKKGSAVWEGGLKDGHGRVSSQSGALEDTPYSFATRFEGQEGSNPEELIGAAHAACFSMALSAQLGEAGIRPDRIETTSTVTLEKTESGFGITRIHLDTTASIPNGNEEAFQKAANAAKAGCPISKLLNAEITLSAKLTTAV